MFVTGWALIGTILWISPIFAAFIGVAVITVGCWAPTANGAWIVVMVWMLPVVLLFENCLNTCDKDELTFMGTACCTTFCEAPVNVLGAEWIEIMDGFTDEEEFVSKDLTVWFELDVVVMLLEDELDSWGLEVIMEAFELLVPFVLLLRELMSEAKEELLDWGVICPEFWKFIDMFEPFKDTQKKRISKKILVSVIFSVMLSQMISFYRKFRYIL